MQLMAAPETRCLVMHESFMFTVLTGICWWLFTVIGVETADELHQGFFQEGHCLAMNMPDIRPCPLLSRGRDVPQL